MVYCILALAQGEATPEAICRRIETLFRDEDQTSVITCSTVHKAKGLERDRVWLLEGTFNPHGGRQEKNIYYVAVTRAKKELYQVYS